MKRTNLDRMTQRYSRFRRRIEALREIFEMFAWFWSALTIMSIFFASTYFAMTLMPGSL